MKVDAECGGGLSRAVPQGEAQLRVAGGVALLDRSGQLGKAPATVTTGSTPFAVAVTGGQFPCKVRKPDDTVGTPNVYDGACIAKWTNKTILIRRLSTKTIVASVVPISQTAGLDATRSPSPCRACRGGEQYKVMAHVGTCSLPCDSGGFTTAGKLFVHQ